MANCHSIFTDFDNEIDLSKSKRGSLATSRDDLREKIRDYFRDKEINVPKFHGQGSYMTYTIITPYDEDYDIDDGMYILSEEEPDKSIHTLHSWVVKAVKNHTDQNPVDKDPCVRILFKNGYHVDLPIYYKPGDESPYLGHREEGWVKSDPRQFIDWFSQQCDEEGQLRRIVRYLKAWKDNLSDRMPSGFALSILAARQVEYSDRDDKALLGTVRNILGKLNDQFECIRPTTPKGEDVFEDYAPTRKEYFLNRLERIVESGQSALDHPGVASACEKWSRHFDDRFSCPEEDEMEEAESYEESAFLEGDARSA